MSVARFGKLGTCVVSAEFMAFAKLPQGLIIGCIDSRAHTCDKCIRVFYWFYIFTFRGVGVVLSASF